VASKWVVPDYPRRGPAQLPRRHWDRSVNLVGHSVAGDQLTPFVGKYPIGSLEVAPRPPRKPVGSEKPIGGRERLAEGS